MFLIGTSKCRIMSAERVLTLPIVHIQCIDAIRCIIRPLYIQLIVSDEFSTCDGKILQIECDASLTCRNPRKAMSRDQSGNEW